MVKLLRKFRRNQSGATAIEYALLAAVMGVGLLLGAQTLNTAWTGKVGDVGDALKAAAPK